MPDLWWETGIYCERAVIMKQVYESVPSAELPFFWLNPITGNLEVNTQMSWMIFVPSQSDVFVHISALDFCNPLYSNIKFMAWIQQLTATKWNRILELLQTVCQNFLNFTTVKTVVRFVVQSDDNSIQKISYTIYCNFEFAR